MKTNSKAHPVFAYIENNLKSSQDILMEYGDTIPDTIKDRLEWTVCQFKKEYCYPQNIKRYGSIQNIFANWLMGIPGVFSVPVYHYEIIQLTKEWQSIPENASEKQEDKILSNWFNFMANKFGQFCKFNKVDFNL